MERGTTWRKVAGGLLAMGWIALLLATLLAGCGARRDASEAGANDAPGATVSAEADAGAENADADNGGAADAAAAAGANTDSDTENATREGGVVFTGDTVVLTLDAETLAALGGGPEDFTGAGFESVEATPGGGVALTMTAGDYEKMLDELRTGILAELAAIGENESEYPSVVRIEADEDFAAFTLTVERAAYEAGMESLVEMLLGVYSVSWQVYAGGELQAPAIRLVDAATGEEYESFTLAG